MMALSIAPEMHAAGLRVALGVIDAEIAVRPAEQPLLDELASAEAARTESLARGRPADIPAIAETRRAYKALGKDPSRYRPSAEALMRRLALGKGLYRINNAVDVINLVSLRTGFSIGGYDADKIVPPVVFRPATEGESYEAIGRGPINLAGLPIFADTKGPFGSPTSDSTRTMVSEVTRRLLMVLIGFGAAPDLHQSMSDAVTALQRHCAARNPTACLVGKAP